MSVIDDITNMEPILDAVRRACREASIAAIPQVIIEIDQHRREAEAYVPFDWFKE